jgi:beta-ureidopropionase
LNLRVAAVQLSAFSENYDKQLAKIEKLVTAASETGAGIVCLPELMTSPYFARSRDPKWRDLAEPLEAGPTYRRVAALAQRLAITVVATCYERRGDKLYNTAFIVGADGRLAGRYAKTHIPHIEAVQAYETCFFDQGEALPVFEIAGRRLGILICYDRSFPEAWRTLALKGAEIIFVPTSSSGFRGGMYADELKIAAAQQQLFVVAANKAGAETLPGEPGSITFYGKSRIIGPSGNTLAALEQEEDTFIVADLDPAAIATARDSLGYYRDRRRDLYAL